MPSSQSMLAPPLTDDDDARVAAAQAGDRDALDALLARHRPWIFNLALRMVWRRDVAEDATQEILLRAARGLAGFAGRSRFSTWLYRIAVNHLLGVRQSEMEAARMTFTDMGRSLDACADADLPDPVALPIDHALLVEEARVGCMTAMLQCLDRRQRLAFILGEVFGVDSEIGAAVLEVSAANFRQLLTRARRDLYAFMQGKCGLVNRANPCRCARKTTAFVARGWLDPARRQFTVHRLAALREVTGDRLAELQGLDRAYAELFRATPVSAPDGAAPALRDLLRRSTFAAD